MGVVQEVSFFFIKNLIKKTQREVQLRMGKNIEIN